MRYEGMQGAGIMMARPDAGNTRTVDTVVPVYMKKVEKGKARVHRTLEHWMRLFNSIRLTLAGSEVAD